MPQEARLRLERSVETLPTLQKLNFSALWTSPPLRTQSSILSPHSSRDAPSTPYQLTWPLARKPIALLHQPSSLVPASILEEHKPLLDRVLFFHPYRPPVLQIEQYYLHQYTKNGSPRSMLYHAVLCCASKLQ
jgi:hypothetical protein